MSKCNKLNKAPLLQLAMATPKGYTVARDDGWERMHCQFSWLEWPEGQRGRAAQCAPTKIANSFPAGHSRPGPRPALTGHLESGLIAGAARRGSDSTWGGRRGKDGPGRGSPNSRDCRPRHPGSLPPHALAPAPQDSRADPCRSRSRRRPGVSTPLAAFRFESP